MTVIIQEVDETLILEESLMRSFIDTEPIRIENKTEMGLTEIKARIHFVPKTFLQYYLLLKKLYLEDINPHS